MSNNHEATVLVTVVIPMYNAEGTIIRSIESVLEQTVKSIEIIVVNDGSTDGGLELVTNYISQKQTNNIRLINKKNGGVSSARNMGMEQAKGNYIAFLDADDAWLPNKLAKQLQVIDKDKTIGMVGCNSIIDKVKKGGKPYLGQTLLVPLKTFMYKNYFQPSTVVIRKEVMDTVGFFDETQHYAEEGNYFMRVAKKYQCVLLNERLIEYGTGVAGFNNQGLSGNLKEMEKGELKNLKYAHANGYINLFEYVAAVGFSIVKYFRRVLIVKLRSSKNA
jgi:glycosyltransferase involved in cell wall biosynthesis